MILMNRNPVIQLCKGLLGLSAEEHPNSNQMIKLQVFIPVYSETMNLS